MPSFREHTADTPTLCHDVSEIAARRQRVTTSQSTLRRQRYIGVGALAVERQYAQP